MTYHEPWKFTDEDCARLRPICDLMTRLGNHVVKRSVELSDSLGGRLLILQAGCEWIGEHIRELVMQQVDRGEWAARGITCRAEMDVTVRADAEAAYHDDAELLTLCIQPVARLS